MKAETSAEQLLAEHGIVAPPVDVHGLADQLEADVAFEELEPSVSGLLVRSDWNHAVIVVNDAHAEVRQRFTIAHEIGHLLLHKGRPVIVDHLTRAHVNMRDTTSSLATSREEIQANQFAAALLMPAAWIASSIEEVADLTSSRQISALSSTFNVSEQAMEYRLINLGLRAAP